MTALEDTNVPDNRVLGIMAIEDLYESEFGGHKRGRYRIKGRHLLKLFGREKMGQNFSYDLMNRFNLETDMSISFEPGCIGKDDFFYVVSSEYAQLWPGLSHDPERINTDARWRALSNRFRGSKATLRAIIASIRFASAYAMMLEDDQSKENMVINEAITIEPDHFESLVRLPGDKKITNIEECFNKFFNIVGGSADFFGKAALDNKFVVFPNLFGGTIGIVPLRQVRQWRQVTDDEIERILSEREQPRAEYQTRFAEKMDAQKFDAMLWELFSPE